MTEVITVPRKLDGKGRLILPRNFREAADFDPFQEVSVALADLEGEKNFRPVETKQLTLFGLEE